MALKCIANCVGNRATEYTSPYLCYFLRFGKIVEDFKNRQNELKSKRDEVKDDVDEALRQTEVIKKGVEEWLTKAGKELAEARSLEEEIERKKCFNWCSSCGWRYRLSIKVAKKTLYISQLLAETCNFQRVGQRPPLQGIEFLTPQDIIPSESSNSALNGIMKALNSDGVNMIGLYGMPGVGKTTLADVVLKQATEQQHFGKVVSVTVSQTPNLNEIRARIAELFGLKFEASTEKGKAEELWRRLKGEKKILIILDDVWKELELQTIGIPFGGEHEGCKILLTTRLQQVCFRMNCQEKFELKILSEDEAWALFKDKADVEDDCPTLNVAKEVARGCDGLPLAIVTVAKALKGSSLNGWMVANQRLKDSRALDNQDVCGDIYSSLELSYDYLEGNVKSCFLLCYLLPEDFEKPIEILVMCGIGQGLFHSINSVEALRWEIYSALSILQQSGLLLETDYREKIKMHKVVRGFAHWITSKGENIFMLKDGSTKWPTRESFECYKAISLWNIEINHLPNEVKFSNLKILFLKGKNSLRVSCAFFESMTTLQVLLLQDVVLTLKAPEFLTNLRTLCFINCELKNISSLRYAKNLEVFALLHTHIHELPEALVELYRLKSLYFSYFREQDSNFFPSLLSRLTSLQELHVTNDNNVNLSNLNSLSGLTGLTLTVSTDQCSQESFVFPKLQSYNIAVNEYLVDLAGLSLRTLRIHHFSSSLNAFKELFCNVERLTLSEVTMEHTNIVPNVDQRGLKELTSLKLTSCDNLECLIDTTREQSPTTALSNLVNLDIHDMTSLKELCHGQLPISFLKKLKTLCIFDCEQLQSVFQMNGLLGKEESQTRTVSNLRSLKLGSLPALESIWKEPTHHMPSLSNLTCLELDSLPELRCIWGRSIHLVNLQHLKTMKIWSCSKLEYLFSPTLAQALMHLEELCIKDSDSLEHLITQAENGDEIVSNKDRSLLCWPKLKSLEIASCKSLRYVFPITLAQGLPYLESVQINDCPQLLHVFNMAKEEDNHDIVLPKLERLRLEDLQNWRSFCPSNCSVMLPSFKGSEDCNTSTPIND